MKKFLSKTLLMAALATAFVSCKDNCVQTVTYRGTESVRVTLNELRTGIKTLPAQDLDRIKNASHRPVCARLFARSRRTRLARRTRMGRESRCVFGALLQRA